MNRPPAASPGQKPIQDARVHIAALLEPARKRVLRKLLVAKPKAELIDAIFEMVHLPDLIDYFREDIERDV